MLCNVRLVLQMFRRPSDSARRFPETYTPYVLSTEMVPPLIVTFAFACDAELAVPVYATAVTVRPTAPVPVAPLERTITSTVSPTATYWPESTANVLTGPCVLVHDASRPSPVPYATRPISLRRSASARSISNWRTRTNDPS